MRQQTPTLAARLRAAWTAATARQGRTARAETTPVEDFATRLRAAVRAAQH